ncbi:MAG: hypothetical protein V5B40_09175 [Candidatus Accumulibacter meliphilus]
MEPSPDVRKEVTLNFGCGLPGWATVRWVFNFIEKNRDAAID